MRKAFAIVSIFVCLVCLASPVYAQVRIEDLTIVYEDADHSTANLHFSGEPPFAIYRSLDGTDWGEPLVEDYNSQTYTDTGLDNYFNYYYKIQENDGHYIIGAAYPPNNNVHSSLKTNTSLCAVCHSTHAASGLYLITQPTEVALCTTCHDGSQSKYDVRNGKVKLANGTFADTSAGPFGPLYTELPVDIAVYQEARSLSTGEVTNTPTSIHNLGTAVFRAPGGVGDQEYGLSCCVCHDPHGVTGNFRNLKRAVKVTNSVSVPIDFKAYAKTDPGLVSGYGEDVYYDTGSIFFCSACHSDHNQPSGSGKIAATSTQTPGLGISPGAMNKFIHAVNTPLVFRGEYYTSFLPLEAGTGINVVVCLTCHYAHGTAKSGVSKITNSSALMRLDRQAVCQECHKK